MDYRNMLLEEYFSDADYTQVFNERKGAGEKFRLSVGSHYNGSESADDNAKRIAREMGHDGDADYIKKVKNIITSGNMLERGSDGKSRYKNGTLAGSEYNKKHASSDLFITKNGSGVQKTGHNPNNNNRYEHLQGSRAHKRGDAVKEPGKYEGYDNKSKQLIGTAHVIKDKTTGKPILDSDGKQQIEYKGGELQKYTDALRKVKDKKLNPNHVGEYYIDREGKFGTPGRAIPIKELEAKRDEVLQRNNQVLADKAEQKAKDADVRRKKRENQDQYNKSTYSDYEDYIDGELQKEIANFRRTEGRKPHPEEIKMLRNSLKREPGHTFEEFRTKRADEHKEANRRRKIDERYYGRKDAQNEREPEPTENVKKNNSKAGIIASGAAAVGGAGIAIHGIKSLSDLNDPRKAEAAWRRSGSSIPFPQWVAQQRKKLKLRTALGAVAGIAGAYATHKQNQKRNIEMSRGQYEAVAETLYNIGMLELTEQYMEGYYDYINECAFLEGMGMEELIDTEIMDEMFEFNSEEDMIETPSKKKPLNEAQWIDNGHREAYEKMNKFDRIDAAKSELNKYNDKKSHEFGSEQLRYKRFQKDGKYYIKDTKTGKIREMKEKDFEKFTKLLHQN